LQEIEIEALPRIGNGSQCESRREKPVQASSPRPTTTWSARSTAPPSRGRAASILACPARTPRCSPRRIWRRRTGCFTPIPNEI